MKKICFALLSFFLLTTAFAGEKDKYVNFSSGWLHKGTFNSMLSLEFEKKHHNAFELYCDLSYTPDSTKFFRKPEFCVGTALKQVLYRQRNHNLRLRGAFDIGIANDKFKSDLSLGFEFNRYFKNGMQLFILQKNDIVIGSRDHLLRNGVMIGIKLPLKNL